MQSIMILIRALHKNFVILVQFSHKTILCFNSFWFSKPSLSKGREYLLLKLKLNLCNLKVKRSIYFLCAWVFMRFTICTCRFTYKGGSIWLRKVHLQISVETRDNTVFLSKELRRNFFLLTISSKFVLDVTSNALLGFSKPK